MLSSISPRKYGRNPAWVTELPVRKQFNTFYNIPDSNCESAYSETGPHNEHYEYTSNGTAAMHDILHSLSVADVSTRKYPDRPARCFEIEVVRSPFLAKQGRYPDVLTWHTATPWWNHTGGPLDVDCCLAFLPLELTFPVAGNSVTCILIWWRSLELRIKHLRQRKYLLAGTGNTRNVLTRI